MAVKDWHIYNPRGGHIGIVQAEGMAEARRVAEERWPGEMGACVGKVEWPRKRPKPEVEPVTADD